MNDTERRMLDFERKWWKVAGGKAAAIDREFGLPATHYYEKLDRLLEDPEALAYSPDIVTKLRRQRRKPL